MNEPNTRTEPSCHADNCERDVTHAGPSETANPDAPPRYACKNHAKRGDERL